MISHRLVRHRSSDLRTPASIREFPNNRENNREICELAAIRAVPNVNSRSNSNVLYANSRCVGNREFIRRNRESFSSVWFHGNSPPAFGKCIPLNGARLPPRQPSSNGRNSGERRNLHRGNLIAATCKPAIKESI